MRIRSLKPICCPNFCDSLLRKTDVAAKHRVIVIADTLIEKVIGVIVLAVAVCVLLYAWIRRW